MYFLLCDDYYECVSYKKKKVCSRLILLGRPLRLKPFLIEVSYLSMLYSKLAIDTKMLVDVNHSDVS